MESFKNKTVSQQRTGGGWTIVTKTAEVANKIVNNSLLTIGPEQELYRIQPRLPRSTLLTLPYVDPEISNDEIFDYFCEYGYSTRVTDEFYKDEDFKHVKTGRRLVFIRLAEGSTPPPYCFVNNQKMSVSYRGKENVCFHCHVEGQNRAQCPIQEYKTCYNCGSPLHSYSECYGDTLVTYYFDKETNCDPYCYPKNYKGEEGIVYGEINCKEDVFDYHVTFNPKFYTLGARLHYEAETYARRNEGKKAQQNKEQRTISEDMDFNDTGPAATQRLLTTNELTADAQETSSDKRQKNDKQEQEKTAPQPTESTEITRKQSLQKRRCHSLKKLPNGRLQSLLHRKRRRHSLKKLANGRLLSLLHHHNLRKQWTYQKRRTRMLLLLSLTVKLVHREA